MKRLVIFFILSILLFAGNMAGVMAQNTDSDSETYIILYDEAHFQYFTADMMETALNSLNTSLDHNGIDVTVELVIQEDEFNSTNLQGVDLIMITNPGLDNGTIPTIEDTEASALDELTDIGGSVFYLNNPLTYDQNITGHADAMNDLVFNGFSATIRNSPDGDNVTVVMDDFNYENNQTYVKIGVDNFNQNTLTNELNNLTANPASTILYYGTEVVIATGSLNNLAANTSQTGYSVNPDFSIQSKDPVPEWLFGTEYNSGARGLMVGSTIMFSDLSFDNSTTKWVDQYDNLELFQNMIAWLLGITPLPDNNPIVDESFGFFRNVNILTAGLLGVGLFVASYVIFKYQNRLNDNILNIFTEKSGSDSKSKTSSKASSSSKSSKKTKRRKRN